MPLLDNKAKADKYHKIFRQTFGVQLMNYFSFITGFDIIKFDEKFLKTPDGISMGEYIREKYGEEAVDLIKNLF